MKIFCISDLHTELTQIHQTIDETCDVIILAGDVGDPYSDTYLNQLSQCIGKCKHVLVVSGNHEYYSGRPIDDVDQKIRDVCDSINNQQSSTEFTFLQRSSKVIDGFTFYGCTLWTLITDLDASKIRDMEHIHQWSASECRKMHLIDVQWLRDVLAKAKRSKTIVITHHLPSHKLIHMRFRGSCESGYASDLDHLLKSAKCWFIGHTHNFVDQVINQCRCIVNPIGYSFETSEHKRQFFVNV